MAETKNQKVRQAIALEYDPADSAPKVLAIGRGALADKIIDQAKQSDVPIHKDDKLANTLSKLQIGDMIPPELYEVVAEILMFVDNMDKIKSKVKAYQDQQKGQKIDIYKINTRKKGSLYEQYAANYLYSHGIDILEYNYRIRRGEIDLIGKDGEYTVFFEVKYRRDLAKGTPAEAVTYQKQKNICKVADYYRFQHQIGEFSPIRYDVIAICGTQITWYKNAFTHIYS